MGELSRVAPIIYRFIEYWLIGTFSRVSVSVKIKYLSTDTRGCYTAHARVHVHAHEKNVEEEIAYMAIFCCSGGFSSGSLSNL